MDILPFNFRACQMCGLWFEDDSFLIPKMIYRSAVIFVVYQFTLGQIAQLATMKGSVDQLTEILFVTVTFVALCFKIFNFVSRRDEMCQLLTDFRSPLCQTITLEEQKIIQTCSEKIKIMFLGIMSLSQSTGLVLLFIPFLTSDGSYQLPFNTYQPYNISSAVNFWITYTLQFSAVIYGVLLNVTLDTMAYGFIIMATGQYAINYHRLLNATTSIKECIEHHILIQDVVLKIQNFFIRVIVPLFFFSLITLCTSIFQMSQKNKMSFEFLSLVMYLVCMLAQIYLYCWFGNELELKSKAITEAAYLSQWVDYSTKNKKNVWFLMLSAQRDSHISCYGQCSLSLDTFLWIVKTSYGAFNLLQRASNET